ncbi:MAG: DHA1 family bicyclomycin/chloramphenicol resistance-like MFS transporter [Pseudorhodobacter sp.]|jgi:DHA1 family bicyclomycin/chloramphenicol resistance-like MFS transporter
MDRNVTPDSKRLGQSEFIAMIAMLFATIAFSIDAMLPALPTIAQELTPGAPNNAQLILTSFVLGMGAGTLIAGPLSDSFGRRTIIAIGVMLYCAGAAAAYFAPSLEMVLAARVVQGLGAAGPRVVSLALVRDLYKGRDMARVISFAMMIFTLVPAIAPLAATGIISAFGWRSIFLAFILFSLSALTWVLIRQPETLPVAKRRPFRAAPLWAALKEVLSYRVIVTAIGVQALVFASLFGILSSIQPIFSEVFDRSVSFPLWFAFIAICAGLSSPTNAMLVGRFGMRTMITITLFAQVVMSLFMLGMSATQAWPEALILPAFIVWAIGVFAMTGLTLGNLNALALEPVGHISGMAASVTGSVATVLAVALAAPIGLAFNGTILPLTGAVALMAIIGFAFMKSMPRS